jgi:hypothetical protein
MSHNKPGNELSSLLVKNKAEENDIRGNLEKTVRILDSRIEELEASTATIRRRHEVLECLKKEAVTGGFITGNASIVRKIERTKKMLLKELHELSSFHNECRFLVERARNKVSELQGDLEAVFNSRKAVEKLEDSRSVFDEIIREVHEDYTAEELQTFKKYRE